ncbi:MAG: glycosyltransferase family 2 protein [Victivallaceae bacterium]|nr:glycosyltransferase family 2 protein [Victivallaceae bacterium]
MNGASSRQKPEMPLLSVILPVYNVPLHYLRECVESVLHASIQDLELIAIDDASPDRAGWNDLKKLAEEDPRIKLIEFAENSGVSAARNAGLEAATGEFIGFIDGDDMVEPDFYEKMIQCAKKTGASFVFGGFRRFCDSGETVKIRVPKSRRTAMTDPGKAELFGELNYQCGSKIIRRESLGGLRFDTHLRIGEDILYLFQCFLASKQVSALPLAGSLYRMNPISATAKEQDGTASIDNQLLIIPKLLDELEKYAPSPEMRNAAESYLLFLYVRYTNKFHRMSRESVLVRWPKWRRLGEDILPSFTVRNRVAATVGYLWRRERPVGALTIWIIRCFL